MKSEAVLDAVPSGKAVLTEKKITLFHKYLFYKTGICDNVKELYVCVVLINLKSFNKI